MTDNRLMTCAQLVKGIKAVDVGTDHGYLAVHLISQGICSEVIACDINEKPLNAALKTVEKAGLQENIKIVLSDGLDEIQSDGITDVIMAGMGGELIVRLIEKCPWLKDRNNPVNLVFTADDQKSNVKKMAL